jgi:integrase
MDRAIKGWGQQNIKTIGFGEIEDFLHAQKVSNKTKSNLKSGIHSFFKWVSRREIIPMPDFPEVSFELGWRQTVSKDIQEKIIDEVYRISYEINPKIWLGIKMLSTYILIRPRELINIKEKEIDLSSGYLFIPHPKEKKAKAVPLIDEDIEILQKFPKGLFELHFFRHPAGIQSCKPGQQFGERYLYKWWEKACENLGIEGVDLYGGTRHSSAMALRELATPEQIKRSMMTSTNKAFERYFRVEGTEVKAVYSLTRNVIENYFKKGNKC